MAFERNISGDTIPIAESRIPVEQFTAREVSSLAYQTEVNLFLSSAGISALAGL